MVPVIDSESADNYDDLATTDDGSCLFTCMNNADNYNPQAIAGSVSF